MESLRIDGPYVWCTNSALQCEVNLYRQPISRDRKFDKNTCPKKDRKVSKYKHLGETKEINSSTTPL